LISFDNEKKTREKMRFSGMSVCTIALVMISLRWLSIEGQSSQAPAELVSAEQIVAKMAERNLEREQALRELESSRVYRLQYHGLGGSKDAEMLVRMNFQAPATKRFTILSQSGSSLIIDHVLKKLLENEQEAMSPENRRLTALTPDNYEFSLVGYEPQPDGGLYVLNVTPRNRNKFLYRGRIWVSARDFAVTRIEAVPAKNPSFWIKRAEISHRYVKIEDFWLPAENRTESQIRLGGQALLTIEYANYQINAARSSLNIESFATSAPIPSAGTHAIPSDATSQVDESLAQAIRDPK
jgi:hypothetical protein